jgi:spore maturation protein SpmB
MDTQAQEAKLALVTILSTAAAIGIDVDQLCHLAANELTSDNLSDEVKPHAPSAIFWIGVCLGKVTDPA